MRTDLIETQDRAALAGIVARRFGLNEPAFVCCCLLAHYGQSPLVEGQAIVPRKLLGGAGSRADLIRLG
ncbi:hypothetical protein ACEUZ9_001341 [Paracoccus litorisediminis]|uniref:hypothetical protein n=1 Tax=Paracoccus litorisediminis TaxID=2006130 RepID=UPI00372EA533